jgi:hypothetical protein
MVSLMSPTAGETDDFSFLLFLGPIRLATVGFDPEIAAVR